MSVNIVPLIQLLVEAKNELLYNALISQLNKDFNLAGLSFTINSENTPEELQQNLFDIISTLINTDFDGFLSFLYRIDLSETKIRAIPKDNFESYIEQVSFLVLKREWLKVWCRKKYS